MSCERIEGTAASCYTGHVVTVRIPLNLRRQFLYIRKYKLFTQFHNAKLMTNMKGLRHKQEKTVFRPSEHKNGILRNLFYLPSRTYFSSHFFTGTSESFLHSTGAVIIYSNLWCQSKVNQFSYFANGTSCYNCNKAAEICFGKLLVSCIHFSVD